MGRESSIFCADGGQLKVEDYRWGGGGGGGGGCTGRESNTFDADGGQHAVTDSNTVF